MIASYTNKLKITLWISVVYVLSFICYVPTLLEQNGFIVPNILLYLKYLYVCIPAIVTIFLLICEQKVRVYFAQMLSGKIAIKYILVWAICIAVGILSSYCYSFIAGINIFKNTYLTVTSLIMSSVYLLITALVEEIAWRGFLLERLPFQKKINSVIFVGVVWAVWHMPMWIIRNSLGIEQIICLCVWTLLVSVVLGITYCRCRNIMLIAVLHATFNICYLAPMQYNIVVLAILIFVSILLYKKLEKKFFT
ncbi:MAG: type II CAAX endopeptidase family protein [Lachnospiraceae bacterium]|nr:type II CAAX endopeptidase family protein [Lachnospiraceae bacterium]